MRIHPFTCIRPTGAEPAPHPIASRANLEERMSKGELTLDAGLAVYVCEGHGPGSGAWTGIVCCCDIDDIEDGTISCSERLRPKDPTAFEALAEASLAHINELGAHGEVATLVHASSPALEVLLGAMKTATPLYRLDSSASADPNKAPRMPQNAVSDAATTPTSPSPHEAARKPRAEAMQQNTGTNDEDALACPSLAVWRVSRPEAIEALRAVYEPMLAQVTDERGHLLAEAAERLCLREHGARDVVTGREPFNVFPALLVAADAARQVTPTIPDGLFAHPLS